MMHKRWIAAVLMVSLLVPLAAPPAAAYPAFPPGAVEVLSLPGADASNLVVATTPTGIAVAAWATQNASGYAVYATRYTLGSGWSSPAMLENSTATLGWVRLVVDASGSAVVTWIDFGSPATLRFSRGSPGGGWRAPAPIANMTSGSYFAGGSSLAISSAGDAFALWIEGSSGPGLVWGAVLPAAGGLLAPTLLSNNSTSAVNLAVSSDTADGVVVAWCDWNGVLTNTSFVTYAPPFGWSPPGVAAEATSDSCSYMAAASSATQTTVLYLRITGGTNSVESLTFSRGTGWSVGPTVEDLRMDYVQLLVLSAASDGTMAAGWLHIVTGGGPPRAQPYVAVFAPTRGWSPATPLENLTDGLAPVSVAALPGGVALAATFRAGFSNTLRLHQYSNFSGCPGWSEAAAVPSGEPVFSEFSLAVGSGGAGVIVFDAYDGANLVVRGSAVALSTPPPFAVDTPTEGSVLNAPLVQVTGSVWPNSTVRLGTTVVNADTGGRFSMLVPLAAGPNPLHVEATLADVWDPCTASVDLTVTFDDPIPGLESALANATARLTEAEIRMNQIELSGVATAADLAAARDELNDTRALLNATRADLAAAQVSLNASHDELVLTKARFDALSLGLDLATNATHDLELQVALLQTRADTASAREASEQAQLAAAQSAAGLALMIAALGVVLGAAGLAFGLLRGQRSGAAPDTERLAPRRGHTTGQSKDVALRHEEE